MKFLTLGTGLVITTLFLGFNAQSQLGGKLGKLKDLKEKATQVSQQKKGPLDADEQGKLTIGSGTLEIGKSDWMVNLDLPHPPKYYSLRWCASSTCDYDHGSMTIRVELDGKHLASVSHAFWNADYETNKSFMFLLLPKADGQLKNDGEEGILDSRSEFPLPLLDWIYGPMLTEGKHNIRIRVFNPENAPKDMNYESDNQDFFAAWDPVADQSFDFNVTEADRATIKAASSLVTLAPKKGGEWTALEDELLKGSVSNEHGKLLRIAVTSNDWNINRNGFGIILSRSATAQVIYTSKWGCRANYTKITEQYDGSKYGKPMTENISSNYGVEPFGIHSNGDKPIPCDKVK